MTAPLQLPLAPDPELTAVADELLALDRDGARIARVLRRTYDMLLNGKDTGRYRWDQLHKSESLVPNRGPCAVPEDIAK